MRAFAASEASRSRFGSRFAAPLSRCLVMQRSKDRLALLAHGREASSRDCDPLHAERPGALTKQRQRLLPGARLDLGEAIIHLT